MIHKVVVHPDALPDIEAQMGRRPSYGRAGLLVNELAKYNLLCKDGGYSFADQLATEFQWFLEEHSCPLITHGGVRLTQFYVHMEESPAAAIAYVYGRVDRCIYDAMAATCTTESVAGEQIPCMGSTCTFGGERPLERFEKISYGNLVAFRDAVLKLHARKNKYSVGSLPDNIQLLLRKIVAFLQTVVVSVSGSKYDWLDTTTKEERAAAAQAQQAAAAVETPRQRATRVVIHQLFRPVPPRSHLTARQLAVYRLNTADYPLSLNSTRAERRRHQRGLGLLIHPDKCDHDRATEAFQTMQTHHDAFN